MNKKIFILGGGQSAIYAAREIRKNNADAEITILGEEKFIPYERPPLSKDFLLNKRIDELESEQLGQNIRNSNKKSFFD